MHLIQWHTLKTLENQQHQSTTTSLTFYYSQNTYKLQYADDITIITSHTKYRKAQQLIQPYLDKIYESTIINNIYLKTTKVPPHF